MIETNMVMHVKFGRMVEYEWVYKFNMNLLIVLKISNILMLQIF